MGKNHEQDLAHVGETLSLMGGPITEDRHYWRGDAGYIKLCVKITYSGKLVSTIHTVDEINHYSLMPKLYP